MAYRNIKVCRKTRFRINQKIKMFSIKPSGMIQRGSDQSSFLSQYFRYTKSAKA